MTSTMWILLSALMAVLPIAWWLRYDFFSTKLSQDISGLDHLTERLGHLSSERPYLEKKLLDLELKLEGIDPKTDVQGILGKAAIAAENAANSLRVVGAAALQAGLAVVSLGAAAQGAHVISHLAAHGGAAVRNDTAKRVWLSERDRTRAEISASTARLQEVIRTIDELNAEVALVNQRIRSCTHSLIEIKACAPYCVYLPLIACVCVQVFYFNT